MKTNLFGKTLHSLHTKKISKPFAIFLSIFFVVSIVSVLAILPAQAATDPLSGAYWLNPVPADQSTGRVTQSILSNGVSGYHPRRLLRRLPNISRPKRQPLLGPLLNPNPKLRRFNKRILARRPPRPHRILHHNSQRSKQRLEPLRRISLRPLNHIRSCSHHRRRHNHARLKLCIHYTL